MTQIIIASAGRLGRIFFGLGMMGAGVQQIITGQFVRLVPALPPWIPALAIWPYVVGIALLIAGLMLVVAVNVRSAAGFVGGALLLNFLFRHIPALLSAVSHGYAWTNPLKVLALIGGALLLISRSEETASNAPPSGQRAERLRIIGRSLYSAFIIVAGVQHFVYADFVDTLIPSWIPEPRFWTYFAGVALIAGGSGLFVPAAARRAALLSGLMIFGWVILLHIPRAISDRTNPGETSAIFEALALSGVAFIIAGNLRSIPRNDPAPAKAS